jgi:hypothetical protein
MLGGWPKIAAIAVTLALFTTRAADAASSDPDALRTQLRSLATAESVTLMMVSTFTSFITRMTPEHLPANSCIFKTSSHAAIDELLNILTENMKPDTFGPDYEVRIGIAFESGGRVLNTFFFQDGRGRIRGHSDWGPVLGDVTLPDRLRSWAIRDDVLLAVNKSPGFCGR